MSSVLTDFLTRSRYAQPLAVATNLALGALLLWLVVRLAWTLLAQSPLPRSGAVSASAPSGSSGAPIQTPLASWHLFGNALPAADPRRSAQAAPESASRLRLHGVYAGEDPAEGRAIIADEQGNERGYRVGDELPGGLRLAAVYPDKVSVRNGGALETLTLPRDTPSASAAPNTPGSRRPAAQSQLPGGPRAAQPFVNPTIAPMNTAVDRAAEKLRRDPQQLARDIQVQPVLENGRFTGIRLSSTKEAALLARAGLQPDDVITAVNGIPLDNPARSAELTAALQNADRASVTVRRGGRPVTFEVSLRQSQ